jgi:hypothetical protein
MDDGRVKHTSAHASACAQGCFSNRRKLLNMSRVSECRDSDKRWRGGGGEGES